MIEKFMLAVMAIGLVVVVSALLAFPVMWLWNGVTPNLFAPGAVKQIDFWNAWGLAILCGFLFKSNSSTSSD